MTASARVTDPRVTATRQPLLEAGPGGVLPPLPKTAWLEIDLDALVSNFRILSSLLPAGARIEPVVKADAYGHGAVAVSRALVADGAVGLSVATFDEALELRQAGIEVPLFVLFPIPAELAPDALGAVSPKVGLSIRGHHDGAGLRVGLACGLFNVLFFVYPGPLVGLASAAAHSLF